MFERSPRVIEKRNCQKNSENITKDNSNNEKITSDWLYEVWTNKGHWCEYL